ncbi:MAG: hypothetical protein ACXADB_09980 [Candidatus Hermodarchaeia archaeon]|jgi:hypothetical protein
MPEIDLIQPTLYDPIYPYHWLYDNLPLQNILTRIDLVNFQVDINADILRNSTGTAGTLNNRLAQSLEDSGSLKTVAVDESMHNIAFHTDGSDGISTTYVRMLESERDKLAFIDPQANQLDIEVESVSTTELLETGTARFRHSDTVTFTLDAPDIIKAHTVFPPAAAHQHFYDLEPAHLTPSSPDYQNYKTTGAGTAFMSDTLRVYVNGIRLSDTEAVYVYDGSEGPDGTWILTSVSASTPAAGTFTLNRALNSSDVIRIDFDQSLAP